MRLKLENIRDLNQLLDRVPEPVSCKQKRVSLCKLGWSRENCIKWRILKFCSLNGDLKKFSDLLLHLLVREFEYGSGPRWEQDDSKRHQGQQGFLVELVFFETLISTLAVGLFVQFYLGLEIQLDTFEAVE